MRKNKEPVSGSLHLKLLFQPLATGIVGRSAYRTSSASDNNIIPQRKEKDMKKTINLLNEVVKMGFSREKALRDIDASLDEELAERKPLMEEEISDQLYEDILFGFRCEAEEP
jgi:hypothetical protein